MIELADTTTPHDAVRHDILRAYLARETGDAEAWYAAAKRAARDAEAGPLHLVASALLANAARRVGKDREAAKLLESLESEAQSARPGSAGEALVLLAEAALAGDELDRAERLVQLNLSAHVEEAESLRVRGAIDVGRERYARATSAFVAALDALAAGDSDERLRAQLVEHGLHAAIETIDLAAAHRFRSEYEAVEWKAPLAEQRFSAASSLGSLALLEGDVESAWALARDAVAYAQSPASKALGETNAARMSALIGDTNGSILQLRRAGQILRSEKWAEGDAAAIASLLTFAAEAATRLTTDARKAMSLAQSLGGKATAEKSRHATALDAFAAGRIAEATGAIDRAIGHYERALAAWSAIEFRTRAAVVALDLRRLSGDDAYLDDVDAALERAPKAWFRHEAEADDGPVAQLTNAERGVLLELLHGKSTREIAEESERSEYTISNHTRKIFAAFEVHSRSRLLARCVELGITEETIERGTRPIVPVGLAKRR